MHPRVFETFDRICRARRAGGDVLEIGAVDAPDTLLALPSLRHARSRMGINRAAVGQTHGFDIRVADANDLSLFPDASFDVVLSNAVFEHDARFWKSAAEMRRVARAGAVVVVGVPGFTKLPQEGRVRRATQLPGVRTVLGPHAEALAVSTLCLQVHRCPEDYYRFSPAAMRDVLLEGLADVSVEVVMTPPRIIGSARKA